MANFGQARGAMNATNMIHVIGCVLGASLLVPSADASPVGGALYHEDLVPAYTIDLYEVKFQGGERASILVDGNGYADLDLIVQDETGRVVCADEDKTDAVLCQWTPARTGTFKVAIRNYG